MRGLDENKLEKISIEKTPVFKKKQNSDIACWISEKLFLRQKLFILKFLAMPKTVKGGPLTFFNIHSVAKFRKKNWEPIGVFEIFSKKQKMRIFKSHSAKKSERRDPLGFFNIRSVAKYHNKLKGGPSGDIKKLSKKSHKAKKGGVSLCRKIENLLRRNSCKKNRAYSRVRTRILWVGKQASYH